MKITEALIAEHVIFLTVFDQIENALPGLSTPAEISTLARVIEGLLLDHSRRETDLAYRVMDHVLAHKGPLDRLYQDHREIDDHLARVRSSKTCSEGRDLLKLAIGAAREHFQGEEEHIFPLIEQTLNPETLVELGQVWLNRNAGAEVGK
jgi:hemerythrin-like domain-containing protein